MTPETNLPRPSLPAESGSPEEATGESFAPQSLTDHLRDLRSCLLTSTIAVFVGFALCYGWVEEIGRWLFQPLTNVLPPGSTLIFTSYQEGFFFI